MALNSFAPTAALNLIATATSASVQLPSTGSPTAAVVTNLGEHPVFVQLGGSTVVAAVASSLAIMPAESVALTLGTNTYLAAIALAGVSQINIAVGS